MYYRPKVIAATAPPPRRQRAVCRSAGVFDFALFPWWRFAICRRHVCCTAYLQPLALRRRLDVPSTGRVSPLALSSRQSPVVTVPNIASFSLASRQKGEVWVLKYWRDKSKNAVFCFYISFTTPTCAAYRSAKLIKLSAFTPVRRTRTAAIRSLNLY